MKPDNKQIREWATKVVRDLAYVSPEGMGEHVLGMLGRAWMMGVEQEREDCAKEVEDEYNRRAIILDYHAKSAMQRAMDAIRGRGSK